MRILKRIFDFYLDASMHVALGVFALSYVTWYTLNIPVDLHLALFLFFGTVACYNFVKYGVEADKYILVAKRYHKNIQFLSIVLLFFALYQAYFLNPSVWMGIAVMIVLTGLYALPLLPNTKNLRSWAGFKIFIVALVWAVSTVILPVLSHRSILFWDVWVEFFQRYVFILILLVPFEIRDLIYDSPELKTLPQRFGVARTKIIGTILVLVFFFSTFLKDDIAISELLVKGVLFILLGWMIYFTRRNQSKYFASFWVESIPVFWLAFIVLVNLFF
ncbi:hypothetical protein ACOCEA_01080 [Maribacter sp. CXY002]|uniref:hypothetical protein n=1 Tax=Maribacter luteocoastalis TaxID=3407671 RepID=UPI003B67A0DE